MKTKTLVVGSTVRHIDGEGLGSIARLIGQKGIGDGIHARVLWDVGGSSVVRLDLLVKVWTYEDNEWNGGPV